MDNIIIGLVFLIVLLYCIVALRLYVNAGLKPNNKKAQKMFYVFMSITTAGMLVGIYFLLKYVETLLKPLYN